MEYLLSSIVESLLTAERRKGHGLFSTATESLTEARSMLSRAMNGQVHDPDLEDYAVRIQMLLNEMEVERSALT